MDPFPNWRDSRILGIFRLETAPLVLFEGLSLTPEIQQPLFKLIRKAIKQHGVGKR